MVGIIKREYDEAEKPAAAPLTPDSTPGKSGSKRLGDEASSEDSSPAPAPAPSKKRVKQNKNFSARSKVSPFSIQTDLWLKSIRYKLSLFIGNS